MDTLSTELISNLTDASNRTSAEIKQDISNHRTAISDTINSLDDRIQEATDWRTHVGAHPYLALGVAAGAGLMLSGIFVRKASPQERIMDAVAESVEAVCGQARNRFDHLLDVAVPRHQTALQGVLLTVATQFVTNILRGKKEETTSPPTIK